MGTLAWALFEAHSLHNSKDFTVGIPVCSFSINLWISWTQIFDVVLWNYRYCLPLQKPAAKSIFYHLLINPLLTSSDTTVLLLWGGCISVLLSLYHLPPSFCDLIHNPPTCLSWNKALVIFFINTLITKGDKAFSQSWIYVFLFPTLSSVYQHSF